MFMKFTVPIPDAPGKLVRKNRGGETFVEYEFERTYDPVKQITYPKRASIGKVDKDDTDKMYPKDRGSISPMILQTRTARQEI